MRIILLAVSAFSCSDSRRSANDDSTENTEEPIEKGSGEDISPQLIPDDSLSDTVTDVDTISSAAEAERKVSGKVLIGQVQNRIDIRTLDCCHSCN